MLAKIRADILTYMTRRTWSWEKLLPERFVESATQPDVPTADQMKGITRGLSRMLDGLASMLSKKRVDITS